MPTETPEPNKHLKAGEINFDLIPTDWALTPLQGKRAYVAGWTTQPYSIDEIKREFDQGKATGVGLITGVWSNSGGMIWVDIDGTGAIKDLEELAGAPISAAFPPTLTISSVKPDRQRMLFSVPAAKLKLLPDKATIKIGIPSLKSYLDQDRELLWVAILILMVILQLLMVDLNMQRTLQKCLSGYMKL